MSRRARRVVPHLPADSSAWPALWWSGCRLSTITVRRAWHRHGTRPPAWLTAMPPVTVLWQSTPRCASPPAAGSRPYPSRLQPAGWLHPGPEARAARRRPPARWPLWCRPPPNRTSVARIVV